MCIRDSAEAAHAAWEILISIIDGESSPNHERAEPSRITQILDSFERAPALKQEIEDLLTDPHKRNQLRTSLEHTLGTSRGLDVYKRQPSDTRKARAISGVDKPPSKRSVSATRASRDSTG